MGAVPSNTSLPDPPPREEGGTAGHIPVRGDWPCQQEPVWHPERHPRLVAFMYRLLRDGAQAPGDVEQHAIQAGLSDEYPIFTNPHLEQYALALVQHLAPEIEPHVPDNSPDTAAT